MYFLTNSLTIDQVLAYLDTYGYIFVFLLVFFEYLNFPFLPAAIIMPASGFWASITDNSLTLTILISSVAALSASIILYYLGYKINTSFLEKHQDKKIIKTIIKYSHKLRKRENLYLLVLRLTPAVRTLISIPCGINKMNFKDYITYSYIGIIIQNSAFMIFGYVLNYGLYEYF